MKAVRTIVPIMLIAAVIPSLLLLLPSDRSIRIVFIGLVFSFGSMAGRELAALVPVKAAVIGGAFVWGGLAAAFATGFGIGSTTLSGFLGYLAILILGATIPLTLVIEGIRRQRRGE